MTTTEHYSEAWCNCQGDVNGPWHPHGDTQWCPPMCAWPGPRIGEARPYCISPKGHEGQHLAHSSWHREIKHWNA